MSCNNFKNDHTNSKRIHVHCTIFIVTMSFNVTNKVYTLDRIDTYELEKFAIERNVEGLGTRFVLERRLLHSGVVFIAHDRFFG